MSTPHAATPRGGGPDSLARDMGIVDILVFERADETYRLAGGVGRGSGWAGIVEVPPAEAAHLGRAVQLGAPIRIDEPAAVRVAGPYWSRRAAVVPVGDGHVVVLGASEPIGASDAALLRTAARAVAETGGVPAEKLLADELELVHALRALMAYRPETVQQTLRHVARVAARALACEYVAVRVEQDGRETLEVLHRDRDDVTVEGPDAARFLAAASTSDRPIVEHGAPVDPRIFEPPVVSRMTVPLGREMRLGALALAHASEAPRGFTMLCQRIGVALAEAAELLITQAHARERLAEERDLLHRLSRTDALTGVGNRVAWQEAIDAELGAPPGAGERPSIVLSADLDGLKRINDAHGHPVGDFVIRAAANLLRSCLRDDDLIARVGGDEFLALCRDSGPRGAAAIIRRIARATRVWRVTEHALVPQLSVGWASVEEGDFTSAVRVADARMYAAKRRRARRSAVQPDRRHRPEAR